MDKSYQLDRPVVNNKECKRPRRKYVINNEDETGSLEFIYKCYNCDFPYTQVLNNVEIECTRCSSRIIRKEPSKKPHVVSAV
tara:strand:+ start:429 stop:674 length:246 start_codon:yes stop_codon:yes gene_type:complete